MFLLKVSALVLNKRGFSGDITFYGVDGEPAPYGIGACENMPVDRGYYVAVGVDVYSKSQCGQCVQITFEGKTTIGPVADLCPSCHSGLDISLPMFGELVGGEANARNIGRLKNVQWDFVSCPEGKGVFGGPSGNKPQDPVVTDPVTPTTTIVAEETLIAPETTQAPETTLAPQTTQAETSEAPETKPAETSVAETTPSTKEPEETSAPTTADLSSYPTLNVGGPEPTPTYTVSLTVSAIPLPSVLASAANKVDISAVLLSLVML
ncbi:hypothetical protein EDD86DRAFT_199520 [Gorgonomyces haynaldii]|nr:hypothetical protein EDD86DRAFT_199520 [Gorgonomyces haynaldii]